jgi:UPF0271 protein
MARKVDFNCDLGESFGAYQHGYDEQLMPYISSANIACGFHAGDPVWMRKTVSIAEKAGVAIGAHPSLPDLVGFGRREMKITPEEAHNYVVYQIGALQAFTKTKRLQHVKPHGALYNVAARDVETARAVVRGVARAGSDLILVGLAGSALVEAAREAGLAVASEGFADRAYNPDGTLHSRRLPGALLESPAAAAEQALRIARDGTVTAHNGEEISLHVDTICIHGDTPAAVEIAQAILQKLAQAGVEVAPLGSFVRR